MSVNDQTLPQTSFSDSAQTKIVYMLLTMSVSWFDSTEMSHGHGMLIDTVFSEI